jgi:hypothetical protein
MLRLRGARKKKKKSQQNSPAKLSGSGGGGGGGGVVPDFLHCFPPSLRAHCAVVDTPTSQVCATHTSRRRSHTITLQFPWVCYSPWVEFWESPAINGGDVYVATIPHATAHFWVERAQKREIGGEGADEAVAASPSPSSSFCLETSRLRHIPSSLRRTLMPFQMEAVEFALRRNGRALLGDDMGLGKTLQAMSVAYALQAWPVLGD